MKILGISDHADTAGVAISTKLAFNRIEPGWDYRTACRTSNYIGYPKDLAWEDAYAHWVDSDVVHVDQWAAVQERLNAPDRPMVLHQHGVLFRRQRAKVLLEMHRRKAIGLAATLDLYLDAPDDLEWMPAPCDISRLQQIREQASRPDDGILRVGHNPTNRAIKSTELLVQAVDRLKRRIPIDLVLTEKVPWEQSLRVKAGVDVYFDQAILGYGLNAVEAWAMGIPVIAGAEDRTLDEMKRRFGELPFLQVSNNVRSIEQALLLLHDPQRRTEWAVRGSGFVRAWHSEEAVVPQLKKVYERVAG